MKNKFRYHYNFLPKIIFAVFFICWFAVVAINILKIANLFNFYSKDIIAEITTIAVGIVCLVVCFWASTLKYVVTDKIQLKFGFFDLTKGMFEINKMIKIVEATNESKLYINLLVNTAPHIAMININPKEFENFANCVRSKNSHVLFDKAEIEK